MREERLIGPDDFGLRGDVDPRAVNQLRTCAEAGGAVAAVLCADGHVGYSQPIGGAIAYPDHISPSGVGYDIACGNKAVLTDATYEEIRGDLPGIMDAIVERISFGMGRPNNEPVDHPVLDRIEEAPFEPQRALYHLAAKQLGTVGAGNHYVDLFRDEQDRVWVGVHFGSRGFGHKTASGFLALAQGLAFEDRGREGEMFSPPVLFETDSELGQSYLEAMHLAGEYAYAGRDAVVDKVVYEILGVSVLEEVHNHHNFAWREEHFGTQCWVVRKGCTPAFPGQRGFVGASMGEPAVILEGARETYTEPGGGVDLLYSTVHGAGRVMSRTQAAGKIMRGWQCTDRDCDFTVPGREYQAQRERLGLQQHEPLQLCPDHPKARMRKVRGGQRAGGLIDYAQVRYDLAQAGIELRGGDADEAPAAYKRLDEVLEHHADTVRVLHRLHPIGVAMAGPDVVDPFKD